MRKFNSSVATVLMAISYMTLQADAAVYTGSASGFVVAEPGTPRTSITGGQHATIVSLGPQVGVTNQAFAPDGSARAQTGMGINKAYSMGRDGNLGYAGSYWAEVFTVYGGTGEFELSLEWELSGGLIGAGGGIGLNADMPEADPNGTASVRWQKKFGSPEILTRDLSNPNLFLDLAYSQTSMLSHPADTRDPVSDDNFLFATTYDEEGNPIYDIDLAGGSPLNDSNYSDLLGTIVGLRTTWEYGRPFAVAFLLETWADGGGVSDFFSTGVFSGLTLPQGASVVTQTGASYSVSYVPEPGAAVVLLGGLPLLMRRKA